MKKKKSPVEKRAYVPKYKIEVATGGLTLKGEGLSAFEALKSVQKPDKITGKTFVKLSLGRKKTERMFMPVKARRLFYSVAQEFIARNLAVTLK